MYFEILRKMELMSLELKNAPTGEVGAGPKEELGVFEIEGEQKRSRDDKDKTRIKEMGLWVDEVKGD